MKYSLLPLLSTLLWLVPQSTSPQPQTLPQNPVLPGAIETPQGKLGPLGVTYLDELPIVSSWYDLPSNFGQMRNALVALGWDLGFYEAIQRWSSGEGVNELSVEAMHRDALVAVGNRLLLRGPEAQVKALRAALQELSQQYQEPPVNELSSRTFRPSYIGSRAFQEVAPALTLQGIDCAQTQNGGVVVQGSSQDLERLTNWLAEHDRPPATGRLLLEVFVRQAEGQAAQNSTTELPAELAADLAELFPEQRFVRAEGALATFSATDNTPLSLMTTLAGLGPADLPAAQLRLNAQVGGWDPQRGSLSLRNLMLNLELPTPSGAVQNSLATELVLEPGVPTLLGSLNGNRVLFVLRLWTGPG
jgi:hypothetical protein